MKRGLDIAWISLPFTTGVALTALWTGAGGSAWAAGSAALALTAGCLAALLALSGRPDRAHPPRPAQRRRLVLLLGACLGCGGLCGATGAATGAPAGSPAEGPLLRASVALRRCVDAIPFPSEESGPLVRALLTGDRSLLPRETVRIFRESGASHLLALSGLHLGILYLILSRVLTILLGHSPLMRRLRSVLLVAASGIYALVTGASPSILRAFTFILLRETARLGGRKPRPAGILCAALLFQLALRPDFIRSAGFQLSYLAMTGIFTVYPRLEAAWPEGPRFNPLRKVWSLAALSISCQLFTGPVAWLRFGTFPSYFLLTNLVATPLCSLILGLSLAATLLCAAGICPDALVRADDLAIQTLLGALETIADM